MKEIKKFEAYRGKGLKANREDFLHEFMDIFTDQKILGYEISGCMFSPNEEILYLILSEENYQYTGVDRVIKLDLSDVGIEIGTMKFNEDEEEYEDFIPNINLDTEVTKQIKNYKKDIKKFNV